MPGTDTPEFLGQEGLIKLATTQMQCHCSETQAKPTHQSSAALHTAAATAQGEEAKLTSPGSCSAGEAELSGFSSIYLLFSKWPVDSRGRIYFLLHLYLLGL